jgi:cell division septation protein DedD
VKTKDYKNRVIVERNNKADRGENLDWKRHHRKGNKPPAPNRLRWWMLLLAAIALSILAITSLTKWLKGDGASALSVPVAPVSKPALSIPLPPPVALPQAIEKKAPLQADAAHKGREPLTTTLPAPLPAQSAASAVQQPPAKKPEPVKPPESRFTFYKILPDQEVIIADPDIRMLKQNAPAANVQYTLQVASSLQLEDAKQVQEKLSQIRVKSQIESLEIDHAQWYRVKIGPFKDLDGADKVKIWLRNNKIDSVVQTKKVER